MTFTEQLLASPPPGVTYVTYDEALRRGLLREVGTHADVQAGRRRLRALGVAVLRKGEYALRSSGLAYREPVRLFEVEPGAFDLIHVHVFHTRFLGQHPPIVMTGGGPMEWVYANAWHWSPRRIRVANAIDAAIGAWSGATICAMRSGSIARYVAPNEDLREHLVTRGWDPALIEIIPNFLAYPAAPEQAARTPRRLGFVAKDFDAKGGPLVVEAHRRLRLDFPDLELLIVGSEPRHDASWLSSQGIEWLPLVDRGRLLREIYPSIDILVYPSAFDTGVPFSTLEPLAAGIPAVVSNLPGLPDLVGADAGRVVERDPTAIAAAVKELLDPDMWLTASHAATRRFRTIYSADVQSPRLGEVYRNVLHSAAAH
ncbi:glycosyltransferase family 4 protein [Kribbia dieselivorans]|uniref:glycosyltransferase family 4 protein n=1 Tax=Kribbia dieselivorans TaxID=331526 RepID=UPI0014702039|nr:glycosyltransferase family 4 protein [Kribbia dieselivorans]